jgi:flagellar motor protein MotB
VFVTANRGVFSPNGDEILDSVTLEAYVNLVDGAENWELAVLSERGTTVRRFSGDQVAPSITIEWDGRNSDGRVVDGEYSARFTVNYEKGNRPSEESSQFRVDTTPPVVDLDLSPLPFSPDNDGVEDELRIAIDVQDDTAIRAWRFEILDRNDRFFHQFTGRSEPAQELIWDGRSSTGDRVLSAEDYPYRFTISDEVGNISEMSGEIPVDILVVRDGDRLKVQIADITFLPNSPRLVTDETTQQGAKNRAILLRLAEVFDRYDTYRIRIEGHAVNVTGTEREEREELAPLSLARAQEVKDALVDLGMNPRRISVLGRGGTEPVVPHSDTENRWKNRRVEFILLR